LVIKKKSHNNFHDKLPFIAFKHSATNSGSNIKHAPNAPDVTFNQNKLINTLGEGQPQFKLISS
jgi:hypothetical protein